MLPSYPIMQDYATQWFRQVTGRTLVRESAFRIVVLVRSGDRRAPKFILKSLNIGFMSPLVRMTRGHEGSQMDDASENVVLIEERTQGVVLVTINRASRKNALNLEIKERLAGVLVRLERDPAVRVVVLTGAGGCFVAGTDLSEMVDMTPTNHTHFRPIRYSRYCNAIRSR
jgi:hypothetical protein